MEFFARLTGRVRWNFVTVDSPLSQERWPVHLSEMHSLRTLDLCFLSRNHVCVTCYTPPPARVTLSSFSTRGFTRAAITIITGLRASFRDRATDRCPLTFRRLRSFCEIDLTYSLVYANWRCVAPRLSERHLRVLLEDAEHSPPFSSSSLINSLNFTIFTHYIPNSAETRFIILWCD